MTYIRKLEIMINVNYYNVKEFKNLREMLEETEKKFGDRTAYFVKSKQSETFTKITYKEFKQDIDALGTALIDMGLKDEKIAVIGENCYEWATTYMATVNGVGCIVPLDKELPEIELENLLTRSKAKAIFFTDKRKEAVINISKKIDTIKYFVNMTEGSSEHNILDFKEIILKGKTLLKSNNNSYINSVINNEEMNMLLFTSGTTSKSKGVMLSHKNLCSNVAGVQTLLKFDETDTFLSVLPMHHSYEATIGFLTPISVGASVGFCEGLKYITKNLQELKPTILTCVPAIVEGIYRKSWIAIEQAGKKEEIEKVLSQGELSVEKARTIFKNIYEGLGGRLRLFLCGAATSAPEVVKGMRNFGVFTLTGYGLTEASPVVTLNQIENYRDASIGLCIPTIQMRVDNPNAEGVGELVVKGPNVMIGYYEDEEQTKAVLEDGWLRTGDLVYVDDDGFIYVAGREKNVIITKNGKNVYPEEMEVLLSLNKYIKECVIFAKELKRKEDSTVAVSIFPDMEKINEDYGKISEEKVLELIKEQVREFNKTQVSYKVIKYVELRNTEFAKTTSMKIKRYV